MRTMASLALLVFGVLAFVIKGADPVQAACVHNKAHYPIFVNFRCGSRSGNNWTIYFGEHQCCPGEGGKVYVRVAGAHAGKEIDNRECRVDVGAHGWVTVYQDGKHITVKSRYQDGSDRMECSSTIVGD